MRWLVVTVTVTSSSGDDVEYDRYVFARQQRKQRSGHHPFQKEETPGPSQRNEGLFGQKKRIIEQSETPG